MQERAKRKLSAILSAKGGNSLAKPLLEEVIPMEPKWAAGYVGLGMIHLRDVWYRWRDSPLQSMQEPFRLAQEGLALKEAFSSLEKAIRDVRQGSKTGLITVRKNASDLKHQRKSLNPSVALNG